MLEFQVDQAGTQARITYRRALATQPWRVDQPPRPRWHSGGDAVQQGIHIRLLLIAQQLVRVIQHLVAQKRQIGARSRLHGHRQIASLDRTGYRSDVMTDTGFLERHVSADPRRGAQIKMRSEVAYGGTNGHGRGVHGTRHYRCGSKQPQGIGELGLQGADDVCRAHQLRQFACVDTQCPDQAVVVTDVMRIAIVGHPGGQHRVTCGAETPRQAHVHIVEHIQKLVRLVIPCRVVVKDVGHVPGRVHAGQ